MSTTSKMLKVGNMHIHYHSGGQGPLMLFLHGFPEFWYTWRQQLAYFAKSHFVVAPDLRGYNLSSKPEGVSAYSIDKLVADIKGLLLALGHQKMTLVAHDWGGVISWVFAARYPELIDRLVILNAPHPALYQRELRANPKQQKASEYMLLFRNPMAAKLLARDNYAALSNSVLDKGLQEGTLTKADQHAYQQAWAQPQAVESMLNYYRAITRKMKKGDASNWPSFDFAGVEVKKVKVTVPTLVIWGEQDRALMIENLKGLEEFVPNLTIKRLPECSHFLMAEASAEINQLIESFCKKAV